MSVNQSGIADAVESAEGEKNHERLSKIRDEERERLKVLVLVGEILILVASFQNPVYLLGAVFYLIVARRCIRFSKKDIVEIIIYSIIAGILLPGIIWIIIASG